MTQQKFTADNCMLIYLGKKEFALLVHVAQFHNSCKLPKEKAWVSTSACIRKHLLSYSELFINKFPSLIIHALLTHLCLTMDPGILLELGHGHIYGKGPIDFRGAGSALSFVNYVISPATAPRYASGTHRAPR